MGELLDLVLSLEPESLRGEMWVSKRDVGVAYGIAVGLDYLTSMRITLAHYDEARRRQDKIQHLDLEEKCHLYAEVENIVNMFDSAVTSRFEEFVRDVVRRYAWLRYVCFLPLMTKRALLVLVSRPPQKVYERGLEVDVWWNYFLKVKYKKKINNVEKVRKHKPVPTVVFYNSVLTIVASEGRTSRTISEQKVVRMLEQCHGADRLISLFEEKVRQYTRTYGKKSRALANAFRDILRVFLGNIYLVWTYMAYSAELIDRIVLPRELKQMPLHVDKYIDPMYCVYRNRIGQCSQYVGVDIRNITWRWAVKQVLKQLEHKLEHDDAKTRNYTM